MTQVPRSHNVVPRKGLVWAVHRPAAALLRISGYVPLVDGILDLLKHWRDLPRAGAHEELCRDDRHGICDADANVASQLQLKRCKPCKPKLTSRFKILRGISPFQDMGPKESVTGTLAAQLMLR